MVATRPGMGNVRAFTDMYSPTDTAQQREFESYADRPYQYRLKTTASGTTPTKKADRPLVQSQALKEHTLLAYQGSATEHYDMQGSKLPFDVFDPLADPTTYDRGTFEQTLIPVDEKNPNPPPVHQQALVTLGKDNLEPELSTVRRNTDVPR